LIQSNHIIIKISAENYLLDDAISLDDGHHDVPLDVPTSLCGGGE